MRVLVVGAGIAGLTVGLRLRQLGIEAMVVESAPNGRGGGYMIDFFGLGVQAADRLGLGPQLETIHDPVRHLAFVDERGVDRFAIDYRLLRRRMFGGQHYNFLRGDLEGLLLSALAAHDDVRFNHHVVGVTPASTAGLGVGVRYSDGTTDEWDLVIGADGLHSTVRKSLLASGEYDRAFLGHTVAAWMLDRPPAQVPWDDFTTLTAPGRMVAVYPVHSQTAATFFIHRSADSVRDMAAGPRSTLHAVYGDLGWIVPDLLGNIPADHLVYFDRTEQMHCHVWHRGRVVLLGDACWCVSLLAGQGASLAMAGGVALAEEVAAAPDRVELALGRYDQRMRPLTEQAARAGARMADWFVPRQRWRMIVRDVSLRAGEWPLVAPLVGRRLGISRASL